jgi:diguanylate cyclase (GGDEF)-like protein
MLIDGALGSEALDSSGEVLDVKGADVSDADAGTLLLNYEHQPGEDGADTIVGKVIYARKIFARSDCENDRQRMYWDQIQLPYIYGICRLYDGAGHENAQALAAMIRDHVANGEMIAVRFSVEGSTLERDGNRLKQSVIRRVALTLKPCNRTANSGLLEDPNAPEGFDKKPVKERTRDLLDLEGAEKAESSHPLYDRLGGVAPVMCNPVMEDGLNKTLSAGSTDASPSSLTGGAALQREHIDGMKKRALAAFAKYSEGRDDFDKGEFRDFLRHELPEASDSYLDHFRDLVDEIHVKRSQIAKAVDSDIDPIVLLQGWDIQLRKHLADLRSSMLFSDPRLPCVYAVYLKIAGNLHRAGRFMLLKNELHILEDYYDILGRFLPEGPLTARTVNVIQAMQGSPHLDVKIENAPEKADAPAGETAATAAAAAPAAPAARPASVFHYHRPGMDQPHTLEFAGGVPLLDGNRIGLDEALTVLGNIKSGAASIRYKKREASAGARIAKMEGLFADLMKAAQEHPPAQDLISYLRQLEAQGIARPGTADQAVHHIYGDSLTPGIGNKKAWQEFNAQNKPGVHVAMDGTDFSAVNNAFGHQVGDEAISTFGRTLRSAMDASGAQGKLFRAGGDEFNAHFPSHEHAMKFARALHQQLEAVPPVQGAHKLSIGMGLGTTHEQADQALYRAKEQKYLPGQDDVPMRERKRAFPVGSAPNMAHSLVPGHEGPIPLHNETAEAIHHTLGAPKPAVEPAHFAAGHPGENLSGHTATVAASLGQIHQVKAPAAPKAA